MKNLNVNIGVKEYSVNGDTSRILRVNTTDINILTRLDKAETELMKIASQYENIGEEITVEVITDLDTKVREQVDYIFDGKVSDIIFGNTNCISVAGGQPIFMNFLDVILPVIKSDIVEEQEKSEKKISKYTSQVKK